MSKEPPGVVCCVKSHGAPAVVVCPHARRAPRCADVVWFRMEAMPEFGIPKHLQALCKPCRQILARGGTPPIPFRICAECLLGEDWEDHLIDVQPKKGVNP